MNTKSTAIIIISFLFVGAALLIDQRFAASPPGGILGERTYGNTPTPSPASEELQDNTSTAADITYDSGTIPAATSTPSTDNEREDNQGAWAEVLRVIDGDTIEVSLDGIKEKIRLIGMNTPETVDPRRAVECFGKEASAQAHALLDGKRVRLVADPTQDDRDRYRRLLRYVYLDDGALYNREMIAQGYAYEYTYEVPYQFQIDFKQAQQQAQELHVGLWADNACGSNK